MAGTYPGNLGGTFVSDVASLTRLATSGDFAAYVSQAIFEQSAFVRSGVLTTLPVLSSTVGTRVEVPFWTPPDPTEEVITSSDDWGTGGAGALTPQKMEAATQYASLTHRGFAYAQDDLSRLATGEDPMGALRNYLATAINKKTTAQVVSQLEGLFTTALAANVKDASVTTGEDAPNFMSSSLVSEAKSLLGERGDSLNVMAMHSKVAYPLQAAGMLTFSTDSLVAGGNIQWGGGGVGVSSTRIANFAGLTVIVDDQMPVVGGAGESEQFVCYLMGRASLATGDQVPLRIEMGRNVLSIQDLMTVHYHRTFHIEGTTWTASTDNPTNAELLTDTNWDLAYTGANAAKLIPAVRLVVNSPYGGTV